MIFSLFRTSLPVKGQALWQLFYGLHKDKIGVKNEEKVIEKLQIIVESTFKLSREKGFAAMSLRDLSQAADMSLGSIYSYIGSKSRLAEMIHLFLPYMFEKTIIEPLKNNQKQAQYLFYLLRGHIFLTECMQPWFFFAYMETKTLSLETKKLAIKNEQRSEQIFEQAIHQGQLDGRFKSVDIFLSSMSIKALLQNWYVKHRAFQLRQIEAQNYAEFAQDIVNNHLSSNSNQFELSQDSRPSDLLPLENLAQYLDKKLPEFTKDKKITATQFSAGASNLTYQLENKTQALILRRPPLGTKAKSAHDMVREYEVLSRLEKIYPLAPKPILLCQDHSVLGDDFFIMSRIDGLGIGRDLPLEMNKNQQQTLCNNYLDGLIALHEIDINQPQIASLGKPLGYVERQLEGWQKRFTKARTKDVLSSDKIYQWLQQNLDFDSGYQSLIHNDYKFDNLLLDPKQPEKIVGVLDWEMTTLGDPLMDLGCSLAYWVEQNDSQEMQAIRMMPTHLEGMLTRQQLFEGYCEKRNIHNIELKPYYVFGLFRLAVIAQQIYYRFSHGQTDNPKFKDFGKLVNILLANAQQEF
ncbi:MAG: phosphotransferase [Enterobacterales bacterium]|nr:phosphotransferase [Enterobacterales bacterium]